MSIAAGASPQWRQHFIEIQNNRVKIPTTLQYDVKTRWNSPLNMLERSLRLREFTKDWLQTYAQFTPLWSTPEESRQIEYILEVLQPIRFCTLWMSKTCGVTIHWVFQAYQDIFDHLEMQISQLERKRMQWKVDIREGLVKAKLKAPLTMVKRKVQEVFCSVLALASIPIANSTIFENGILMPVGRLSMRSHIKRSS